MDEREVSGHTCLAGVQEFAPEDTASGHLEVGASAVHEHWRLPSQLEDVGGEVFGCGLGNYFGNTRTSGEEDEVPALLEQRRRHLRISSDDLKAAVIEVFRNQFPQRHLRRGTELTWLDDSDIAGDDGSDERPHT